MKANLIDFAFKNHNQLTIKGIMPPKTPVGEKILSLRKSLKMTQASLAHKIGVSRAAISQFELGETVPSQTTLEKLSQALGFNLAEIWQMSPSPDEVNDEYISLRFLPITAYLNLMGFGDEALDNVHKLTLQDVPVLRIPGVDYSEASVIEIKGNSMAPRYPHGSRYVEWPVEDDLKYATGVHFFILNHKVAFLRRIISNKSGIITLRADATGEESTLEIADLEEMRENGNFYMVKLGQAVYLPAED